MSVTVIEQPFLLAQSASPLPVVIEPSSTWFLAHASTTGYWIEFTANLVTVGEKIIISLFGSDYTIDIVSMGSQGDDGLSLPGNSGAIATWITNYAIPLLSLNYAFKTYCAFTQAGNFLFINAPFEANLSVSTTIAATNVVLAANGNEAIYENNYHIILDVIMTVGNGAETKAATLKAVPNSESPYYTPFDLSPIVNQYLKYTLPDFEQIGVKECEESMGICAFNYAEGYNSPVVYRKMYENAGLSQRFIVAKGGVPFQDFPTTGNTFLLNEGLNKYLSWQPSTKSISPVQQEYLYFIPIFSLLYPSLSFDLNIDIRIKYKNDPVGYAYNVIIPGLDRYKMYCLGSGMAQLDINSYNPTWEVEWYEIQLSDKDYGIEFPLMRYEIADLCLADREKYFIFANSLGGMDVVRTYMDYEVAIRVEKENFQKILNYNYSAEGGEFSNFNIQARKGIKVATGYVSLPTIKWLHELLISEQVYEIVEGKFLPITIAAGSYRLYTNRENLYNLEFSYEYAFNANTFAAPELIFP